ncbi:YgdI/YgdR family lipoprotein [Neobacillus muris]|uniref:YgdI/YgdR family lipoprotein n=1 Tax=Neobacillus muris TaxID=2941334 RepID=UPI00203EB130|nr:YgdI/YgdR family lipoprotein [Neobacillus muris]
MKKLLLLAASATMAFGLAACSSSSDTDKKDAAKATEDSKADIQKELVKFYNELGEKINAKDADLNTYVAKATKEDAAPEELPTPEEKAAASEAAAAVSADLSNVAIPESLKDHKADLEAAVKDFAASYNEKAEELKKDAPNLDAGAETFAKGEEKLGKVYQSEKLFAPSLDKQVN